jgi:hypothetical protein
MNSRLKGHHIYAFAGLVSLVWVGVGTWLRWAPVYVFSEVAVAFFLFVLALISKERYENNLRRRFHASPSPPTFDNAKARAFRHALS